MRTRTRIQAIATTLVLGVSLITFTIRACSSIHVATDLAVVDGDTVEVTVDGVRERVRLLGIDTPERGRCGAEEATARLKDLLTPGQITVVQDPIADARDRYGRLLSYIEVDGTDVGETLVAEGYAVAWWPKTAPVPSRAQSYQRAQQKADTETRGSCSSCDSMGLS